MPKRNLTTRIPEPLPAKLTPARLRPAAFFNDVCAACKIAYDLDDEAGATFRSQINSVDTIDAVTGNYKGDKILAAQHLKNLCRERGIFPSIVLAKENEIAIKFQHWLRQHDTDEISWSRSARLKLLAHQPTEESHLDASGAE